MRGYCSWGSCWWVREGSRWRRRRCRRSGPDRPPAPRDASSGESCCPELDVAAAMEQRIVQGIVDELGELLGERLHVAVFDDRGRGMEIRAEHEGVSGGGVDAVRSPGAAHRGVAVA